MFVCIGDFNFKGFSQMSSDNLHFGSLKSEALESWYKDGALQLAGLLTGCLKTATGPLKSGNLNSSYLQLFFFYWFFPKRINLQLVSLAGEGVCKSLTSLSRLPLDLPVFLIGQFTPILSYGLEPRYASGLTGLERCACLAVWVSRGDLEI